MLMMRICSYSSTTAQKTRRKLRTALITKSNTFSNYVVFFSSSSQVKEENTLMPVEFFILKKAFSYLDIKKFSCSVTPGIHIEAEVSPAS